MFTARVSSHSPLVLAALLALGACGEPKPPVRVVADQPFTGKDPTGGACESLGRAEGLGTSEPDARNALRQKARDVGADTAVIDRPVGKAPGGRTLLHAELLRCEGNAPAAAQAQAETPGAGAEAPPTEESAEPRRSLEERLETLESLHDQGLITQQEYDAKRQELLDEL